MTTHSAVHGTFTIERTYPASPERVYQAFADPKAKARWFAAPKEWEQSRGKMEFKPGGKEFLSSTPPGHKPHTFDCTYLDIVPNERIVYVYEMHIGENKISASLATIELAPAGTGTGTGTRLKITEQGVFLDGYDDSGSREKGTHGLLDQLGKALADA
jgi:uncharacterized protein YndB with AHSA1/START domain